MKKLLLLLLTLPLGAQTLTSIVMQPPAVGFVIPVSTNTVQYTPLCLSGVSTITCPTLTWGSNTPIVTVNSSGLATATSTITANITSWSITSNVLTVIANNNFSVGNLINITGLSHGSYINDVFLACAGGCPILTRSATQFTIALTHANDSATEAGVVRINNGTSGGTPQNEGAEIYAYNINSATITNCAIAGGVGTLTATNTFVATQNVNISASSHCPALVNTPLTILAATGTQFTVTTPAANVTSGADSGTAQTSVLGHATLTVPSYVSASITTTIPSSVITVGSTVLQASNDNKGVGTTLYCGWTTSDATKATVNPRGEITGVGAGSVNITCNYGGTTHAFAITVTNPTVTGNIYYYRTDGGTRYSAANTSGRCNGTVNAADPGSGTNQNCAFNNPMYCWGDGVSTSGYTGAVQSTDRCQEGNQAPAGFLYNIYHTGSGSTLWAQPYPSPPSGLPGHPTQWWGFNHASCTTDPDHIGNRSPMVTLGGHFSAALNLPDVQNFDTSCLDLQTGQDCNAPINGFSEFTCANGGTSFIVIVDNFTGNFTDENSRWHGGFTGISGTPGPGTVFTGTSVEYNALDGFNFDDYFGRTGVIADGFTCNNCNSSFNGATEEQPKALTSVVRDGAGNLNVTFAAGQWVNYIVGNNFVLTGAVPSDLNGTYPVSAITFNQQTVTITGGSINAVSSHLGQMWEADFTTSTAPAFGVGSFVNVTGATPSYLNGTFEVYAVSGTGFSYQVEPTTRPPWQATSGGAISAGGTASTAISLVATAAGSSETASTPGTGGHVYQMHRACDQGAGDGGCNGDAIGTGSNTIGIFNFGHFLGRDNTQDCIDMLHSAITTSIVTYADCSGNMGEPIKFGNLDTGLVQDGRFMDNAAKMLVLDPDKPPDYNQYLTLFYRAGDMFPIQTRMWSHIAFTNNTMWGGATTIIDDVCDDADCTVLSAPLNYFYIQNNIFGGFVDTSSPVFGGNQPGVYCGHSCNFLGGVNANWTYLNNITFNVKVGSIPGGGGWTLTDPLLVQEIPNLASFADQLAAYSYNMSPTGSSPALGAGVVNTLVPTLDFNGTTRPVPGAIGAFELGSSPPTLPTVLTGHIKFTGHITIK